MLQPLHILLNELLLNLPATRAGNTAVGGNTLENIAPSHSLTRRLCHCQRSVARLWLEARCGECCQLGTASWTDLSKEQPPRTDKRRLAVRVVKHQQLINSALYFWCHEWRGRSWEEGLHQASRAHQRSVNFLITEIPVLEGRGWAEQSWPVLGYCSSNCQSFLTLVSATMFKVRVWNFQ